MRFLPYRTLTAGLMLASAILPLLGQPAPASCASHRARPASPAYRLVVGIVVDQLRADYLERFADLFSSKGFNRLKTKGAYFTNAHYLHACTYTAPGHGVVMTGSVPAVDGIIGNKWYDRETGKSVESITDDTTAGVPEGKGASPSRLLVSTLGDELKSATGGQSKVIGISLKNRAAILPAGRAADAAYWFDSKRGQMQTSTYYMKELPTWVASFNNRRLPDQWFGKAWEKLLPESAYARCDADDVPYEGRFAGGGSSFPHVVGRGDRPNARFYDEFTMTPWANDFLVDFAAAAIEHEKLGGDAIPDVLSISFSANDILGHAFGPNSHEVLDMTVRTDQTLARLLDLIDQKVGLDQTLVILTSDHGVSPVPEYAQRQRLSSQRVSFEKIAVAIKRALDARFGAGQWFAGFSAESVYFDLKTLAEKKLDRSEVERVAAEAALTVNGVAAAFTRTQILSGGLPRTTLAQRVQMAFHPQRSGDVFLVPEPFCFFSEEEYTSATTHGTPYPYDTHVPVILMGRGLRPGRYLTEASPSDIAPTLTMLLGVMMPNGAVGRVLSEALLDPATTPTR
ncbi:alkaline phosphatase family protein [Chloracidobacterium validum]|uniref:Alkaline phosphatase family protein n=1 Tax=Chloracidobacterium validum TaxID=2821543 RepID=A0ABX8B9Z5_9BACT|nr:alkaline phosphatase family protein [Chloracidobacterium validum]QUW02375.1 alkaline phosphatase family protein [Chloracidobacterium validum]